MKVLVSDSSILIEFSKRQLLGKMFNLELQFAVPDLLFREELIDLGSYSRQDLVGFGLTGSLDARLMRMMRLCRRSSASCSNTSTRVCRASM